MAENAKGSPERFGYSWARFSELTPEQEQQFLMWMADLPMEKDWAGTRFLDVGCGAGRNSYWAMKHGATSGVACDLDERSLAAARVNLEEFPTVDVRSVSVYDLPFKNEFDIAFSIGVIHHLDDPVCAVSKMIDTVRPGGTVLVWLYGYENLELYANILSPLRRLLFSRMPLPLLRYLSYLPTAALWGFLRLPIKRNEYLRLLRGFPFKHLLHIVFDQMLPKVSKHWRREEAIGLLTQNGLSNVQHRWVNEVSWTVWGTKMGATD